jgi:HAD superfamily hydrolase (TIGR01509 family)
METFSEAGIAADRDQVASLIGADGKKLAREVAAASGKELADDRAETIDKRSGEIYDRLNTDPQPLPGVRDLLLALGRSTLPWAIATSSRQEQTHTSVAALRLQSEPRITDGSHVEHAKPAPDLLLLAARELNRPPAECWYVGDSTWDMLAANTAAMTAVGVPYGSASAERLLEAGASVVTSFVDLLGDLRRRGLIAA